MIGVAAVAAERADSGPILFRFAYRAIPFHVAVGDATSGKCAHGCGIMLHARVGTMPFTVEGPALRSRMLAVLDRARRMPGIDIQLAPDHGICLSASLTVTDAVQPGPVLAAAIGRLVEAKPLLDVVLSLLPAHLRNRAGHSRYAA